MPGENCAIFNCGTCRNQTEFGIFKLPKAKDEATTKWRNDILAVITRDRVVDAKFRNMLEKDKVYICEKHFDKDQLWIYPSRKLIKDGEIPRRNLPVKSIPSTIVSPRSTVAIEKRASLKDCCSRKLVYKEYNDVVRRAKLIKVSNWSLNIENGFIRFTKKDMKHSVPQFELYIDDSLGFTIRSYGWLLPETHFLYKENLRSVRFIHISQLINCIDELTLCKGTENLPSTKKHAMPHEFSLFINSDDEEETHQSTVSETLFYRSLDCLVICKKDSCEFCESLSNQNQLTKVVKKKLTPAKLNAPISKTNPEKVKLTLQKQRKEIREMNDKIIELQEELKVNSVKVSSSLSDDLKNIFDNCDKRKVSPFMKLFWEEQMKCLNTSPTQVKYHPMIIKFCLALYAKSPSAYDHMRFNEKDGTGCLILPSKRTLKDDRNVIRPQTGFNSEVINDLKKKTKNFTYAERFISLSFDEMKIQEDLIWNKNTKELIGYVNLGVVDLNQAVLKKQDSLATHVLVFLIKSIINPLSFTFATFATTSTSSIEIFPLFWRAIAILENCNLKVIAATADGASSNRSFFKIHSFTDESGEVVYKTPNIFSNDSRDIYFFSDAPHLMKTTRNCLLNSGGNSHSSRFMTNNGMNLVWRHIAQFYFSDIDSGLRLIPKISYDHIHLTRYSCMNAKLAVQVLSQTMGKTLLEFGPSDAKETANFCILMDGFFDCLNVRNTKEHIMKRKPFLKPYSTTDDERFSWLKNVFLKYFSDWKLYIDRSNPLLTDSEKSKLFISWQTYEGLQMTCNSLIDCVTYLLKQEGIDYILTENFCQDDLENHFGKQRSIGRRKDNPNLQAFLYNDNLLKSSLNIEPIGSNVRRGSGKWNQISEEPMPKRKKEKGSNLI